MILLEAVAPVAAELLTDPAVTAWQAPELMELVARAVVPVVPAAAVVEVTVYVLVWSNSVNVTVLPDGIASGDELPPRLMFPPVASENVPVA
jgi:hypothetical protein